MAKEHFRNGIEILYLSVEEDGNVRLTTDPPDRRVFVAARSLDQVDRFMTELDRRTR